MNKRRKIRNERIWVWGRREGRGSVRSRKQDKRRKGMEGRGKEVGTEGKDEDDDKARMEGSE